MRSQVVTLSSLTVIYHYDTILTSNQFQTLPEWNDARDMVTYYYNFGKCAIESRVLLKLSERAPNRRSSRSFSRRVVRFSYTRISPYDIVYVGAKKRSVPQFGGDVGEKELVSRDSVQFFYYYFFFFRKDVSARNYK